MQEEKDTVLSPEAKQAVEPSKRVKLHPESAERLVSWLGSSLDTHLTHWMAKCERVKKWRTTLSGSNPEPPALVGVSNVSVPLTMWMHQAVHVRLFRGLFASEPFLSLDGSMDALKERGVDPDTALKSLRKFMERQITNPRALDGKRAFQKASYEISATGLAAVIVREFPDDILRLPSGDVENSFEETLIPGGVRWEPVSFSNIIAWDGYGSDPESVARMPYVGHKFRRTWHDIQKWAALDYYDKEEVDNVKAYFEQPEMLEDDLPISKREHKIAELYMNFDVDNDGKQETVRIDWHIEARRPLGVFWNSFGRYRPIVLAQFDIPADPFAIQGQGVCEKLESPQAEANAIHNIGIEGGKRAVSHLIIVKSETGASRELGASETVAPGTIIHSENGRDDVDTVALGDPRPLEWTIALENVNQQYAGRLMGIDDPQFGNVSSGKRVPAQLGLPIMREGRVIIENPLDNLANALIECVYLTMDSYRRRPPSSAMSMALKEDERSLIEQIVFSSRDPNFVRNSVIISAKARDVTTFQEARKNELMVLSQFLIGFNRDLTQMIPMLASPEAPREAKDAMLEVVTKMSSGVRELLRATESIDNPEELLIEIAKFKSIVDATSQPAQNSVVPANNGSPEQVQGAADNVEALGGGVV